MELHTLSQRLFGFSLHKHAHRHLRDHFIPHEGNFHRPHVLSHKVLGLYSIFLILLKVAVLTSPLLFAPSAVSLAITPENIITLTNDSRAEFGVQALAASPKLAVAAANKARHMMDNGYFAHYSEDGVSPWYWITESGYKYSYAGENLAIRFTTAEGVTDAWLASPAHKANLLSTDFSEIGVAVLNDNFGQEGFATLVVQMFGTPQNLVSTKSNPVQNNPAPQPRPSQPQNQPTPTAPAPAAVPALSVPQINFPLKDSYINKGEFSVIGKLDKDFPVAIFLNNKLQGTADVAGGNFRFTVDAQSLTDGEYILSARSVDSAGQYSASSNTITFKLDTLAPEIDADKFSIVPAFGHTDSFSVTASVSGDAIRTITIVGQDSSVLQRAAAETWQGEITLRNAQAGQTMPVEVYAQDFAGNESRVRVGVMYDGEVAGVFGFAQEFRETNTPLELFGGLVKIPNIEKNALAFALALVAFLSLSLILKILIKRHIQHPRTIAGAAGVMMLALILFVL